MKTVILIRHSKAEPGAAGQDDATRSLTMRGRAAADALGGWLRETGWVPDLILCSPASRTRETLSEMAFESDLEVRKEIYEAKTDDLMQILQDAEGETILLVGHNPAIGDLAHVLVSSAPDHPRWETYPTSAASVIRFHEDVEPGAGELVEFVTPQDLV
ncbi:histidine phosphatase family protein [Roseicyclus sp. F158]|uniref:Histidine phosphatase family protein n=1 Tax=Tropicimonas omnivorans TaxID=3075590 RepID=A0ABU3DEZ5_9RHOB|nr:histidine phosphatase family protein [Roseicyclus sp. F158]MDT0682286.1 histidine phosphatase family protein [Roseicyclus sp. F158]